MGVERKFSKKSGGDGLDNDRDGLPFVALLAVLDWSDFFNGNTLN